MKTGKILGFILTALGLFLSVVPTDWFVTGVRPEPIVIVTFVCAGCICISIGDM
jgi:hypothetical protein